MANMKKILYLLIFSFGLVGCSSIDYAELTSSVSPTNYQIDRILALDLSHTDSINEANKLMDPELVAAVIKELEARKLKIENTIIESERVAEFSEKVKVSGDGSIFEALLISETRRRGILDDMDYQDYFLKGRVNTNGDIQHQINLSLKYTASERRNYTSASICDRWQGCSEDNKIDIDIVLSDASNCTNSNCEYREIIELNLNNEFLKSKNNDGFSLGFNSKRFTNKITISPNYLKGYLMAINQ